MALGPDRPNIAPDKRPHYNLRSRLPKLPPIGTALSGGTDASGSTCQ